jgi:hypothetical protein
MTKLQFGKCFCQKVIYFRTCRRPDPPLYPLGPPYLRLHPQSASNCVRSAPTPSRTHHGETSSQANNTTIALPPATPRPLPPCNPARRPRAMKPCRPQACSPPLMWSRARSRDAGSRKQARMSSGSAVAASGVVCCWRNRTRAGEKGGQEEHGSRRLRWKREEVMRKLRVGPPWPTGEVRDALHGQQGSSGAPSSGSCPSVRRG